MSQGFWKRPSACDIGRAIGERTQCPIELTEKYLSAIEDHPNRDEIYVRLCPDRARAEAKAAALRAQAGVRKHILDGVPISWKDLFDVAGFPTEGGSRLFAGQMADRDADVVAHASVLGSVCLGKTHLSELAFSGLGYNPMTATSPCVHDLERVAGGSSSGAAASVGFDLAAAAIGSDTGGSVRIPAAWNNLVGFKPTHTMHNMGGVQPLAPSLDSIGPLCHTVEDAMALHALINGTPVSPSVHTHGKARLGIVVHPAFQKTEGPVTRAFEDAVERLRQHGHEIVDFDDPMLEEALDLGTYMPAECYSVWHEVIEARPNDLFVEILERFRQGAQMTSTQYATKIAKLKALRQKLWQKTQGFDALILPTVPIMPPKIADLADNGAYYREANMRALSHTRLGNALGCCAITLPTPAPSVGVMLMGPPHEDRLILQRGYELAPLVLGDQSVTSG